MRWFPILLGIGAVSTVLAFLPGRADILPLVESDYRYLLIAADRMYAGFGPTTPTPFAPFQPWTWQADWSFLTQWPIGYPLLICAVRWLFGLSAIQACQWISVVACATALTGWFVWIKRSIPAGFAGALLAAVAAGCALSPAFLTNPSTDAVLVALLPFVLLFATRRTTIGLVLAGLTAGGLFWLRYAGVFVPAAVLLYLLIDCRRRKVGSLRRTAVFAVCAAVPIVTLLSINHLFGAASSVQQQLNLGNTIRFDVSPRLLWRAWWNFTDLGFYDHHRLSHWVFALWPAAVMIVTVCTRGGRRALGRFIATPPVALGVITLAALLVMLVGAAAFFGEKYDYIGLARYYLPGKPLYFLLFVAPVLLIPRRVVRAGACAALLVLGLWIVQQEWARPYQRRLAEHRKVTPYGQWERCFSPDSADLYHRLRKRSAPDLIVVSNFPDDLTLETQIPALPIPPDRATLDDWVGRICRARNVTNPRVLFVLDRNNHVRDYFILRPDKIVDVFDLRRPADALMTVSRYVFTYQSSSRETDHSLGPDS